ncbi:MAG TPA: hypothetical protein VFN13_07475 [Rudaea sp.]|nr:hypothetical protein [Rudaea sp.]
MPAGWKPWFGVTLWCLLALPPVRFMLESSMTLQMLVQIPLLGLSGWWLAASHTDRFDNVLTRWNRSGISGLLLASLASIIWMLPRALDASLTIPWIEVAKFAGVPLLIGVPAAISWPRAGFVVRGVLLIEIVAMAFRLGWLYLDSPVRLCSNYLISDQQQLGKSMLAIGVAISLLLAGKLLWGRIDTD